MEMHINKDRVKKLRLEKSWSQEKLAEAANMNLRTIQRIEKDGLASLRSRAALASALGVEPQRLTGIEVSSCPPITDYRHRLAPAISIS